MPIETELSHDIQFINEAFLSIFPIEAALLRESLDCKFGVVGDTFHFIDGGEVALSEFLEGFEHLMEAFLIDFLGEAENPGFDDVELGRIESEAILLIVEKFNPDFGGKHIFLNNS